MSQDLAHIRRVLQQLEHEAVSHLNEWGAEEPTDGTGGTEAERGADIFREACVRAFAEGHGTWRALAMDRLMAAFRERDLSYLHDALLDAAGLIVAWSADLAKRMDAKRQGTAAPAPTPAPPVTNGGSERRSA